MNKSFLIVGGIILSIAVVVGAYFFLTPNSATPDKVANIENSMIEETEPENAQQKKSLSDLLTLANNQECAFTDDEGNSGVVRAASGKVRGDFTGSVNGKVTQTHMFSDSQSMYIWFEGETTGFKGSISSMTQAGAQSGNKSLDVNKQVDFDCKPWVVNTGLLVVPSEITFTDFSAMMPPPQGSATNEAGQSAMPDVNSIQCAACDNLSGDAAVQCKQALGC